MPRGRLFPPGIRVPVLLYWKVRVLPGFCGQLKLLNYRDRSGLLIGNFSKITKMTWGQEQLCLELRTLL